MTTQLTDINAALVEEMEKRADQSIDRNGEADALRQVKDLIAELKALKSVRDHLVVSRLEKANVWINV